MAIKKLYNNLVNIYFNKKKILKKKILLKIRLY